MSYKNFLKKAYQKEIWVKILSTLLLFSYKHKIAIELLQVSIRHFNTYNPKLFFKVLDNYQKSPAEFEILFDNAIRLYLLDKNNKYFKTLLLKRTDEKLPCDYTECINKSVENDLMLLKDCFWNNINNNETNVIDLNKNKTIDINSGVSTIEINFSWYILNRHSPLDNKTKEELSLFYQEILQICREKSIAIFPVFTNKWLVDYRSIFQTTFKFLHHAKVHNKNTLIFKKGYLPGFFYLNNQGFSGWFTPTSFKGNFVTQQLIDKFFLKIQEKYVTKNNSKYAQSNDIYCIPDGDNRKRIFVILQTVNDVVAELSYIKTLDLLKDIVKIYKNNDDVVILVKRHPSCMDEEVTNFINKIRDYKNVEVTNANIHSLINSSDVVCTVNSGSGFESLLRLKNVVISGKADYSQVCYCAKNKIKLKKHIDFILKNNPDKTSEIKRFIYNYLSFNNLDISAENKRNIIYKGILSEIEKYTQGEI